MQSPNPAAADPRCRVAVVAAVSLGSFIAKLVVRIVNVALPTRQRVPGRPATGLLLGGWPPPTAPLPAQA